MKIEFAFDYASPWAFLAHATAPERFGGLEVSYVPAYLRGFEAFRAGVPYSAAKLAYIGQDLGRIASRLGLRMKQPSVFPIHGLHALRGAIAAEREGKLAPYHALAFAAAWQEDRDVSNKEVVKAIGREAGAPSIGDSLDEPAIKDALRTRTEQVVARGAFGVPTFFVGDQMFWGQDRMLDAARAARGNLEGGTPRSSEDAWAFARRWAGAWSGLDVEKVLGYFANHAVFESPLAKRVTGNARVSGKDALRAYWMAAVKGIKHLRFDVVEVGWSPGERLVTVVYDRTKDGESARCTELLRFDESGSVVDGKAFYGA
jgi:2-hydroxychromene-2-carboxylate isomerase